jgi:hypothetical protein
MVILVPLINGTLNNHNTGIKIGRRAKFVPRPAGVFKNLEYLYKNNETMYKNFKLTDEEKKQILEQHSSYGSDDNVSKLNSSLNEQGLPGSVAKIAQASGTTAKPAQGTKQTPQGGVPQKQAVQGGVPQFNPTIKGAYEVDCKSKLVRLGGNNLKLTKEANLALVDLFCSPKYRAPMTTNATPNPTKKI